jgi:hypothetical protein
MANFLRSAIRNRRITIIFRRAKKIYGDALITLQYSKSDDMEVLRNRLRRYAVLSAGWQVREQFLLMSIYIPLVVIWYGFMFAVYFGLEKGTNFLVGFIAAIFVPVLIVYLTKPILRISKQFITQFFSLLLLALIIFGSTMVASHTPHKPWIVIPNASHLTLGSVLIDGFILLAVATVSFAAVGLLAAVMEALVTTPARKRNSNIVIVNTLVDVLKTIVRKTSRSNDMATRARICNRLQYAAIYLEEGIPYALALPDPSTRQALQRKLTSAAAYLREIQLWVALAKDEAQNDTRDAVAHYIELIVQGKYGSLPDGTLTRLEGSKVSKLVGFSRTLAVAILPFGCLIGAQYAGLKLSSDFTGWAIVIALAWAAITLISAIDPLYKARLKDMQDLIAAVRGKD